MKKNLVIKCKLLKSKSDKPQAEEFTVFINVRIDNLNEFSKLNSFMVNKVVKIKSDKINIRTDKKYLLISSKLKLTSEKNNLFLYILL